MIETDRRRQLFERWSIVGLLAGSAVFIALLAWYKYPRWWASVNYEGTFMTWYESVLLVLCGFAAGLNYRADFILKKEKAWIWLLMFIAFVFMAFDEFFQFHEQLVDEVLAPRGMRLPGFSWTEPGDFVLIVYAFAGLAMIPALWRRLAQRKASLVFFLTGVGLAAISVGMDSLDFHSMTRDGRIIEQFIEEVLETYAMLCFFIAFYLRESFLVSGNAPENAEQEP